MFQHIEFEELPSAHPVATFNGFWRQAAGENNVAPWSSFDAADHPRILPWVMLFKYDDAVDGEGSSLRCTVCGSGCTNLFGFSYQGRLIGEDLPPGEAAYRRDEFERVTSGIGALFSRAHLPFPNREKVSVFRGVFPFTSNEHGVDRIMIVVAEIGHEVT